jgi:hypothetical protein
MERPAHVRIRWGEPLVYLTRETFVDADKVFVLAITALSVGIIAAMEMQTRKRARVRGAQEGERAPESTLESTTGPAPAKKARPSRRAR